MGGPPKGYKGGQTKGKGIVHKGGKPWQQQRGDWQKTRPYHQAVPQPTALSRPAFGQHTPSRAHDSLPKPARPSVRPTSASSYRADAQPHQDEEEVEEESHRDWDENGRPQDCAEPEELHHDWDARGRPQHCAEHEEEHQPDANVFEADEAHLRGIGDPPDNDYPKDHTSQPLRLRRSWQPAADERMTNCYADTDTDNLNQASARLDGTFASGPFIGILKMVNGRKGFGFISPVLSELPPEFSAGSSGLWFFGDHHLTDQEEHLGKHIQFSVKLADNRKPQAVDVMLADADAVADVGSQDFQRTVHDAIINGMQDLEANRCHNGHTLEEFVTQQDGYGCNICEKEFPSHTKMFACRECNVDKCEECYYTKASISAHPKEASMNAQPKAPAPEAPQNPVPTQRVRPKQPYDEEFDKVLVVSTLPFAWTIMDVEQYFVRFGPVDSVFMLPHHDRTCGIVFSTKQSAIKASERTKALIHGSGQGMMGCLTIQHFPTLPTDMKCVIDDCIDEFAPSLKEAPKPPPPKFAMRERLIGTVSSTVVSGMRIISSSKLPSGTAAFDPALAPEDALAGATVAFGMDAKGERNVDGYVIAVVLEVLSRPSPENAPLLAKAAAAAAPRNAAVPEASHKKNAADHKGKEVSLKCFPCKEAVKLGRCADEANCPYAHTLAEVQPLPDTEVVLRVARKRFGKASLLPMAAPSMLPMPQPRPMAFGMMPPVMGVNPFMPSMGMPPMAFGMNPFMMPPMVPKLFSSKKSKKRKR